MSSFLFGSCRKKDRRGTTAVQVAAIVGLVTLVAIAGITQLGTASNTRMTATASAVGDPSSLVGSFGNGGGSSSGSSSGGDSGSSGSTGSSSSGSGSSSAGGDSSGGSLCP